jgi:2-alkenal reductase
MFSFDSPDPDRIASPDPGQPAPVGEPSPPPWSGEPAAPRWSGEPAAPRSSEPAAPERSDEPITSPWSRESAAPPWSGEPGKLPASSGSGWPEPAAWSVDAAAGPPAAPAIWSVGPAASPDPLLWDQPTAVDTTPVRQPRKRRAGSRAVFVAAICMISGVTGAAAALGAVAVTGNSPVAAAPASTPNARDAAALTVPSATSNSAAAVGNEATTIQVAANVAPAVVTIQVTAQSTSRNSGPGGQGGQGGQTESGSGSGVIVRADGWILTNHHVVSTAKTVTVILADGRQFDGTVSGVDTLTDFALVKVDATDLPTATLGDSAAVQVGQTAIAIGSPLGEFPGSVTEGIVSGLDRTISVADAASQSGSSLRHLIQTDAAINPGNSGGALADSQGRIVGINTAEASQAQSIGFALPIDLAKPIIAQAEAGQAITRPWIGILYTDLDAQVAKDQNLGVNKGAFIHAVQGSTTPAVVAGSPAEKAGLKEGDIITALDDQAIDSTHPLDLLLLGKQPGDKVTLTVLRGASTVQIDLTLGTRPASLGVAGGLG